MNFITNFLKGAVIGIGAIIPGVSGGSLAVIFGLYEKITYAIANFHKDFRKNLLYFLPVAFGGATGVLIFSRIMEYLLKYHDVEVKYLFIGLMAGTFPHVFKQANKQGFRKAYFFTFILALAMTILLTVLENSAVSIIPDRRSGITELAAYGAIIGFGTIAPGISASFILMYLGVYDMLLRSISNLEFSILIPTGIGFIVSIVLFSKLMVFLFRRAYGYTYYVILGFVVGSTMIIFPGFDFTFRYLMCALIFVLGFLASSSLIKYSERT
ncbi:MAG: DUF368 domain-containing protein [Bacillota bacterium]